jgi:8-amino-7-oxononanoate synthase
MATLGKALGGYGAFVGGSPEVIEWLTQRARTLIYSTALPPMAAAAAMAAMDVITAEPVRVATLRARIGEFGEAARGAGLPADHSTTAIQPLVLGDSARVMAASARLLERGYLVPGIRPPTVPEGTSRLRVSLSAAHSREDVAGLVKALAATLAA